MIAIWKRHSRNGCGREGRKLLESGGVARGEYLQLRGSKNRDSSIMAPRSGLSPDRGADFCAEHVLKHESPGRKSSREDEGEGGGRGSVIFGSVIARGKGRSNGERVKFYCVDLFVRRDVSLNR